MLAFHLCCPRPTSWIQRRNLERSTLFYYHIIPGVFGQFRSAEAYSLGGMVKFLRACDMLAHASANKCHVRFCMNSIVFQPVEDDPSKPQ